MEKNGGIGSTQRANLGDVFASKANVQSLRPQSRPTARGADHVATKLR
jgi:hypothetical protein